MICFKSWQVMWVRGAMVAVAGFGGVVLVPSISLAQYPGSAGDLNSGPVGASSSASSGSSSAPAKSSSGGSSDGPASGSMVASGSSAGGSKDDDGYRNRNAANLPSKKASRKRALIRQLRLEFVPLPQYALFHF